MSRLVALIIMVALPGGYLAECQGWLATAEARMACCANEQSCPMHKAERHRSGSSLRISQADADRCCASAQHGDSIPASAKSSAVNALLLIPVALAGALDSPAPRFHEIIELRSSPPPGRSRHVLLSVFLI